MKAAKNLKEFVEQITSEDEVAKVYFPDLKANVNYYFEEVLLKISEETRFEAADMLRVADSFDKLRETQRFYKDAIRQAAISIAPDHLER